MFCLFTIWTHLGGGTMKIRNFIFECHPNVRMYVCMYIRLVEAEILSIILLSRRQTAFFIDDCVNTIWCGTLLCQKPRWFGPKMPKRRLVNTVPAQLIADWLAFTGYCLLSRTPSRISLTSVPPKFRRCECLFANISGMESGRKTRFSQVPHLKAFQYYCYNVVLHNMQSPFCQVGLDL